MRPPSRVKEIVRR